MKHLIISLIVSLTLMGGVAMAKDMAEDDYALGTFQKRGLNDPYYMGNVNGTMTTWLIAGIVECESISARMVLDELRSHATQLEWTKKSLQDAVVIAMQDLGCTFDRVAFIEITNKHLQERKKN